MECMANEGLWSDVPGAWSAPDVSSPATSAVGTAVSAPTKSGGTHLPLPDAYVAQMATRSIWLQENIAPGLFEVLRNIPRIFIENTNISLKPESRVSQRRDAFEEYLRNFDWRDAKGKPLKSIPFELRLSGRGGPNAIEALQAEDLAGDDEDGEASDIGENTRWAQTWPPRRFTDIIVLAATLQRCNIFICGLCFGSRVSELGTLKRGTVALRRDGKGRVEGLTFKFADKESGDYRTWPLPKVAEKSLALQVQLARLAEQVPALSNPCPSVAAGEPVDDAERPMWIRLGSCGANDSRLESLVSLGVALNGFARTLCMDTKPTNQRLRPHRLRKTLARLVALALVDAPTILMDVFGHSSLGQTMYYVLTDKALQAELEAVAREIAVAKSQEVIQRIVDREVASEEAKVARKSGKVASDGGLGGQGGAAIELAVVGAIAEKHRTGAHWDASDSQTLAHRLTLGGVAWMAVRPGIFCTRSPGAPPGTCNFKLGRPDPAACQPTCNNRAEADFLRASVEQSIESTLGSFETAVAAGTDLAASAWAGQVLGHLPRFDDISERYEQDHRVIRLRAWLKEQDEEEEAEEDWT